MALFLDMLVVFILHVSTDAQVKVEQNVRMQKFTVIIVFIHLLQMLYILGHAPKCPLFKVQRGTVYKAFINKPLKISCNLMYCDEQTINVTWTKENLKDWIPVYKADQMSTSQNYSSSDPKILSSYLTFTDISKHHGGLYRCELKFSNFSTVSHHINISVSDDMLEDEMPCTDMTAVRENTDCSSDSGPWWLPYLFICLGVVILVVIVMLISILCINGFKSSRRKNAQRSQVQYTATSVWSSPSPSVLKRDEFVCVQYSEESRDSNTCNLTLPPGQSTSYVSDCSDDPLSKRRESRSSQVVYASLHHLTPTPSSATPRQTQEELSEYASIRVS
ncbi:B- and T-lymphocyte attenuator-like [Sinocyclocheilus anshuiensis]|uniref:B- and T-lymphocyte attenuator-like n=1 Tax=Sinocyclocheilus anshuiensis TaxID=1608454 RepID=UPI0007BA541F|nr:PREDICTED: B- and T-lymphocyte attenuator-like [Sinocyclocheilus anshuiensis]